MFELTISTQFKRDLKLARKHGFDESILDDIIKLLIAGKSLPKKNKNHVLVGDYKGCR